MSIKIARTVRFPEVRIWSAGRSTVFGRNLDYLKRLKVGFSEKFAQALKNPRHTLTRFLSDFDLEAISRETGIAGIETGRWLTGLSQVFEWYCHENDLTRTIRVPDGHREMAEYKIIHEEVNPPIHGRRFVLDYEEPQAGGKLELVLPSYAAPSPALKAEAISEQLFQAEELFLEQRFAEAQSLIESALDNTREEDLKPLARLEALQIAAIIYLGMEKQPECLELIEEMFSLFSKPGIDRFSLSRFFDFMITALWKTGNRPLAYKAINLSTDIAGEMVIILEMGDPGTSLMKKFSPVPQQLRTIRNYLKDETGEEAARIKARIARLLARVEALDWAGPERKDLPN